MQTFTPSLDKHQNNTAKWRALKCLHRHGPYELLLLRLAAFPRRYVLGGRNIGCVVWPRLLFLAKTVHARGLPLALFSFRKSACMPCLHPTKRNHTRSHMQTLLDPHKNPHPPTGALDRFAQFFISPLFTESATAREMQAVDSENNKNLQNDSWRLHQIHCASAKEDHPITRFRCGSLKTLLGKLGGREGREGGYISNRINLRSSSPSLPSSLPFLLRPLQGPRRRRARQPPPLPRHLLQQQHLQARHLGKGVPGHAAGVGPANVWPGQELEHSSSYYFG